MHNDRPAHPSNSRLSSAIQTLNSRRFALSTLLDEFGDDPVENIEMNDQMELGRMQGALSEQSEEHLETDGNRTEAPLFVVGSSRDLGRV